MLATVAPKPRDTKVIGKAQHNKVPDVVNNNSQLQLRGFLACFIDPPLVNHPDIKAYKITTPGGVIIIGW